jgi:hypothetical protein
MWPKNGVFGQPKISLAITFFNFLSCFKCITPHHKSKIKMPLTEAALAQVEGR